MKKIGFRHIAIVALVIVFVVSFSISLLNRKHRRIFCFPVIGSDAVVTEVRYLPKEPVQGDVAMYVDELLLGPETQRARPLFTAGTKNEFCFTRGKTLYVGLSQEALYEIPEATKVLDGIAFFEQNIKRNFRGIKSVELFIDKKYVEIEQKNTSKSVDKKELL